MEIKIYKTKQKVAQNFTKFLADFIAARKEAHIALSGGSTPKIVFDELAKSYTDIIDWTKVYFYWGDERCVPPDNDQSNYKMTKDHLLSKINIPEDNIHRIKGENKPDYEADRYSELLFAALRKMRNVPHFDLVILGMGDDGHTASIFPHQIDLWHSKKYCEVAEHPETGQKRITITGQIINNAQEVVFLVTGEGKAEKVREVIKGEGNCNEYPANLAFPGSGKLTWFLDDAAAERLS